MVYSFPGLGVSVGLPDALFGSAYDLISAGAKDPNDDALRRRWYIETIQIELKTSIPGSH